MAPAGRHGAAAMQLLCAGLELRFNTLRDVTLINVLCFISKLPRLRTLSLPLHAGFVSAACLLPQLVRLWTTRSAHDLSYLFLVLYCIGLVFTCVYLIHEGALVAWVCVLVDAGRLNVACILELEQCD